MSASVAPQQAEQNPETFTADALLAVVGDLAALNAALADPDGPIPAVSVPSVRRANAHARSLLTVHLDYTTPRKGAFSAMLRRTLLGITDDDVRLAIAWLDVAGVVLPIGEAQGD